MAVAGGPRAGVGSRVSWCSETGQHGPSFVHHCFVCGTRVCEPSTGHGWPLPLGPVFLQGRAGGPNPKQGRKLEVPGPQTKWDDGFQGGVLGEKGSGMGNPPELEVLGPAVGAKVVARGPPGAGSPVSCHMEKGSVRCRGIPTPSPAGQEGVVRVQRQMLWDLAWRGGPCVLQVALE